jgi:hypothetical protein
MNIFAKACGQYINYLEISDGVCAVSLLAHIALHVPEPVDPSFELDQVGRVRLHREVHGRFSLIYHNGKSEQGYFVRPKTAVNLDR